MAYPEHLATLLTPVPWINMLYEDQVDDISQGWTKYGQPAPATERTMFGFWATASELDIFLIPAQYESHLGSQPAPASGGASFNRFNALNESDDTDDDDTSQVTANNVVADVESKFKTTDAEAVEAADDLDNAWMRMQTAIDANAVQEPPQDPDQGRTIDSVPRTPLEFFNAFNMSVPSPPAGDRPLDDLLQDFDVWSMSPQERQRLHAFWIQEASEIYHTSRVAEFESLRKQLAERQKRFDSLRDQVCGRCSTSAMSTHMSATGKAEAVAR